MKIISWNCNMAFRKKYEKIIQSKPDLLVLQECENEERLQKCLSQFEYNELVWYGGNPNKGVAVISFNDVHIELKDNFNTKFEFIVPLSLKIKGREINLFAIWAMPHKSIRKLSYVGQTLGAMSYYSELLSEESILIGDFNSNSIWDKKKKSGTHSELVQLLNDKEITSLYHEQKKVRHGEEPDPTLYLLKKEHKPYHLDYCFASKSLASKQTEITIGKLEDWIKLSDHMPLIIEHIV